MIIEGKLTLKAACGHEVTTDFETVEVAGISRIAGRILRDECPACKFALPADAGFHRRRQHRLRWRPTSSTTSAGTGRFVPGCTHAFGKEYENVYGE